MQWNLNFKDELEGSLRLGCTEAIREKGRVESERFLDLQIFIFFCRDARN